MSADAAVSIPGYELLTMIREGSTATSWRARQVSLNREVILQILRCDGSEQEKTMLGQIIDQMRKLASIKNEGIIEIIDVGEHDGMHFVVTDLPPARSLAEDLDRKAAIRETEILHIADQVAATLYDVWERLQMMHGNLKPDSILLTEDGTVRIGGLGLTRRQSIQNELTGEQQSILLGTPNYMAPEQVQCVADLDMRVDMYAMGAVLYELATGQMPFHDTPGRAAMTRQIGDQIPSPRELNKQVSPGFTFLVAKMMMKDRSNRYASWTEVRNEIKRVRTSKIFVQKQVPGAVSTVQMPQDSAAGPKKLGSRDTGSRTPAKAKYALPWILFRRLMWLINVVLWVLLAAWLFWK